MVINNPHNATGRIFDEDAIRKLITYCLQNKIRLIDDLAYQNLAPVADFSVIKTVRQIASELVRLGVVDEEQADRVITISFDVKNRLPCWSQAGSGRNP